MTSKSDRRAARQAMAAYHEAQLGQLVARASDGVDDFRTGQLDAFDVDRFLFQYSRAAKELWKFATLADSDFAASLIIEQPPIDWWQRGARHEALTSRCGCLHRAFMSLLARAIMPKVGRCPIGY